MDTAASAQARIAELEALISKACDLSVEQTDKLLAMHARATAAEARADRLEKIAGKLDAAISWLDYPFIDNRTPEVELRQRVGFMMTDAEPYRVVLQQDDTAVSNEAPNDALRLVPNDHEVIKRCVERMPPLYMRGQTEGPYLHSDIAGLIDIIGRLAAAPASPPAYIRTPSEDDRLRRALYRLLERHGAGPDPLSVIGSLWDTLDQGECTDLIEDWLITGKVIPVEGDIDEMLASIPKEAPASPLPGGGPHENVPVKRKLEAGAALRDRLKAVGDGLGSQVVADLVGSLRASHQNSAALFAQLNHARTLLKPFAAMADAGDQRPKDDAVWAGQDGLRITYGDFRAARAFARNGKGEG